MHRGRSHFFRFIASRARLSVAASLTASSFAQKCMKKIRGSSLSMWLCSAVTSMPLSRSALITGLTSEAIVEHGFTYPSSMVNIPLNFQPTGNGRAAITGDFVLIASEVNPVIRTLRKGGIAVTALHSHMLEETPRLFFMHFWANGDARKLATTLRAALDQVQTKH